MSRSSWLLSGFLILGVVSMEAQTPASADFEKSVLPVLSAHCFQCHSDRLKTGGLSLQAFRDSASAAAKPDVWKQVQEKLNAHLMPPPPMPGLSAADLAAVNAWINKLTGAKPSDDSGPGSVTARRLNRIEYDNTIRDLLGVRIHPAEEFPLDDSGYGFDDIGDVLSLSPLLMEKLSNSARQVAKAAVFGESYDQEGALIEKILPKRIQDDSFANGDVFPFSLRGSLIGTFHAKMEGDYEFQLQIANRRTPDHNPAGPPSLDAPPSTESADAATPETPAPGRGRGGHRPRGPLTQEQIKAREEQACEAVPPVEFLFTVDGKTALAQTFRGNNACDYARPPSKVRVHLTAGDHQLRGYFPALDDIDPVRNMGENGRRRLDVEYLDIFGPWNSSHAHPASFEKIFICGTNGNYTPPCQRQIIENLARRAYRRPPADREVAQLMKLVKLVEDHGDGFETGVQTALQAILMSPSFLFRFEHQPKPGEIYRLNDYELASRLSYFLWSSMPDDELMRLADQRRLHDPAVLDAQVKRMMQDPKADNLVTNFAAQWLNLRALDHKKPDPQKFPAVDDELLGDMKTETLMFMREIIRDDHSVLDAIDAPFTYVNGPLARFYGIPGITGLDFHRVALDGKERGGVLTQGSILISTSYSTRTSPVLRGKWVLGTLLGQEPPPPPPGVPAFPEAKVGLNLTLRQILAEHRTNPSCGVCHNQMDPIGLALENYDAAGGWRTRDGNAAIDNSGTLPDGTAIAGAASLKKVLRARGDLFARNVAQQLLTFAIGRGMESSDRAVVDRITAEAAAKNYRFSALVLAIVHSSPFQMREGERMVVARR
ncbi:MAG TPA: DUF1592 domain-containing protein [Bryobacteraceae bacterium]|nr:DUF1592 domain-containing protein [Bryobacteraceae bacterium]